MPLSAKQMEYLALAWQCFETEPKIDYEKFHQLAGLKSVASARELMRVTKNKLKEEYGALGSNGTSSPVKKAQATPRGIPAKRGSAKKSQAEMNGIEDEEMRASPSKKAKKNGAVKVEVAEVEEGSDDGYMV